MNRNYEKEVAFYQQRLLDVEANEIMIKSMLDDALNEIKELKEKYEAQDVERKEISE